MSWPAHSWPAAAQAQPAQAYGASPWAAAQAAATSPYAMYAMYGQQMQHTVAAAAYAAAAQAQQQVQHHQPQPLQHPQQTQQPQHLPQQQHQQYSGQQQTQQSHEQKAASWAANATSPACLAQQAHAPNDGKSFSKASSLGTPAPAEVSPPSLDSGLGLIDLLESSGAKPGSDVRKPYSSEVASFMGGATAKPPPPQPPPHAELFQPIASPMMHSQYPAVPPGCFSIPSAAPPAPAPPASAAAQAAIPKQYASMLVHMHAASSLSAVSSTRAPATISELAPPAPLHTLRRSRQRRGESSSKGKGDKDESRKRRRVTTLEAPVKVKPAIEEPIPPIEMGPPPPPGASRDPRLRALKTGMSTKSRLAMPLKAKAKATYSSVWIKNLPENATVDSIRKLFEPHGTVLKAAPKLSGDGRCTGSGYVIFRTLAHANAAIVAMHGKAVGGPMPLRVTMASQKQNANGNATMLCVRYLNDKANENSLSALFVAHGPVVKAMVQSRIEDGEERVIGFVTFETKEAAAKAAKACSSMKLGDRRLKGTLLEPPSSRPLGDDVDHLHARPMKAKAKTKAGAKAAARGSYASLWIKSLTPDATEAGVRKMFKPFGKVLKAQAKVGEDGKCNGNGYVIFSTLLEANAAITALNGQDVGGEKPLHVARAGPPKSALNGGAGPSDLGAESGASMPMICIRKLPEGTRSKQLHEALAQHGTVKNAIVQKRVQRGTERTFGFVSFLTQAEAQKAVDDSTNLMIGGQSVKVSLVEKWQWKGAKTAAKAAKGKPKAGARAGPVPAAANIMTESAREMPPPMSLPAKRKLPQKRVIFQVGDRVRYWSDTGKRWVEDVVQAVHPNDIYDIHCKKGVKGFSLAPAAEPAVGAEPGITLPAKEPTAVPLPAPLPRRGGGPEKPAVADAKHASEFQKVWAAHMGAESGKRKAPEGNAVAAAAVEKRRRRKAAKVADDKAGEDDADDEADRAKEARQNKGSDAKGKEHLLMKFEEEVVTAMRFLRQTKVSSRPAAAIARFLSRQGLSKDAIVEAFRRREQEHQNVDQSKAHSSEESDVEIPQ